MMSPPEKLIPNRLMFRFQVEIPRLPRRPRLDGRLSWAKPPWRLPALGELDGKRFPASVYLGWHETGLYVAARLVGRTTAFSVNRQQWYLADSLELWVDTRDTRDIHRATRYCSQFVILPQGGGQKRQEPVIFPAPINRAREKAPLAAPGLLSVAGGQTEDGYEIEAHLAAVALHGFAPAENPRLGFAYHLMDLEHGAHGWPCDKDVPLYSDPSLWATIVLR